MLQIIEVLETLVKCQRNSTVPSAEWADYIKSHPSVAGIMAAAAAQKNLTPAILEANGFPDADEFGTTEKEPTKAAADLLVQLSKFARWLIQAGRIMNFTVFGIKPGESETVPKAATTSTKKKTGKKTKRQRRRKTRKSSRRSFKSGSKRDLADKAIRKKLGYGLIRFIREARAARKSQPKVSDEISALTKVDLGSGQICQLMQRYKIR